MPEPKLTVLSLGWGVQSFTLAAMSALGELPKLDFALHSDTTWEREATYKFAEKYTHWLEERGVKVITVKNERAARRMLEPEDRQIFTPVFTPDGKNGIGQLLRTCTDRWKIQPLRKFLREVRNGREVEMWLGISKDEWHRARNSDVGYIENRFPLLDKKMSRQDCLNWLERHGLEIPVKSSCVFCPYHRQSAWMEIKSNSEDWKNALLVDEVLRNKRPGRTVYVHFSAKPLSEALKHDQLQMDFEMGCDSAGYCWA